jgi:LEA14-like dessication related protein
MKPVIALMAWIGALLCGCVTTQFESPKLSIISVGLVSADLFNQQFRLRLHVENPNSRELPIKSIDYQIQLQGEPFADGSSGQAFVVPANGHAEFDALVNTNLIGSIGKLVNKTDDSGLLQYTLSGNVQLSSGWLRRIPFSERGSVPLNLKK